MDNLSSVASARALYYDFFAGLFLYELLGDRGAVLLEQVALLKAQAFDEGDLLHFELLESELRAHGTREILSEYTHTFILPFTPPESNAPLPTRKKGQIKVNPQIMLYLSHYVEGCLNGKSLVRAKQLVKQSTFRLNSAEFKESEEHLGFLLLLMRHLLLSSESSDIELSAEVAKELVIPLAGYVRDELQKREDLSFYSSIGALLSSFLEVEQSLC